MVPRAEGSGWLFLMAAMLPGTGIAARRLASITVVAAAGRRSDDRWLIGGALGPAGLRPRAAAPSWGVNRQESLPSRWAVTYVPILYTTMSGQSATHDLVASGCHAPAALRADAVPAGPRFHVISAPSGWSAFQNHSGLLGRLSSAHFVMMRLLFRRNPDS